MVNGQKILASATYHRHNAGYQECMATSPSATTDAQAKNRAVASPVLSSTLSTHNHFTANSWRVLFCVYTSFNMDLLLAITSKSESASINLTKLPPSKLATTSIATQSLDSGNGSTEDNVFVLTISGTVTLTVQSASDSCSLGEVFLIDSRESAPEPGGLKLATKTETRVQVSAKNVNGRLINKDEMRNANGALLAHGLLTPPRHFKTGPPPGLGNRQGISHIKEESINSQPDLPTITISMTPEIVVTPASDGLEVEDPYKSFFESLRQQDSKLLRVPCYPRGPKRLPRHLDWTDEAFHEMKNCMDGIQEKDEIAIKVFGTPIRRTPRTSLDSLTEADTRKGDRYTSRPKWRKSLDVQATRWGSMISNIVGNPTLSTGSRTATAQLHDALQSRPPLGQYGRSRDDQATPAKRRYEDNEDLCYRERIEYENEARRRGAFEW